jgi:hypothetical protein
MNYYGPALLSCSNQDTLPVGIIVYLRFIRQRQIKVAHIDNARVIAATNHIRGNGVTTLANPVGDA